MKLYLYGRVSTDDQQTSADAQSVRLREFAEKSGLEMGGVFVDEDVSGKIPLQERPRGKELWNLIQPGDAIAFTKVDRCFRSLVDAASTLEKWKTLGIRVHILDLGIDVNTPAGELFFSQLAAFAQFERAMIGLRVREAQAHKRRTGKPYNKTRPIGWRRQGDCYVPLHSERKLAERVIAYRDRGESLPRIALRLCKESIRSADGSWLRPSHVRRLEIAGRAGYPKIARRSLQASVQTCSPHGSVSDALPTET
jgi:DNA invertase Pin-like site-specific DNA recombinase